MTVVEGRNETRQTPHLVDVARLAGVSRGTVSNVLNHPEKVIPATLKRVRDAIEQLDYVRNDAARSLAAGQSTSIGLVIADIDNSVFVDMTHGAQERAHQVGNNLLVGNAACDFDQQNAYLDFFDEARVAGMLLAPMEDSSVPVRKMRAHGRQIVLMNYQSATDDCCAVLMDNEKVGYLAAQHLIESGRTRIAYLAGQDDYQPVHARRLGVRRAVAEAGHAVSLAEIDTPGLQNDSGAEAAAAWLATDPRERADGIVAVTDALAHGFIQWLHDASQVSIPDDVAVVGCEDNRSALAGPLPLSAVSSPGAEMGEVAMDLLLAEIAADREGRHDHRHRTVVLEPSLVVRASSVRARRALAAS